MSVQFERVPIMITIDTIDLNARDDDGTEWVFDNLEGWHEGGGMEVQQEQRTVSHGHFPQAGHRRSIAPTVTGWVYNESRALVAAAMDKLAALLADGQFASFAVKDDDTGIKTATVQRLGLSSDWIDPLVMRFQLQLLSTSPYKYGSTSSDSTGFGSAPVGAGLVFDLFPGGTLDFGAQGTSGTVTVINEGTATAPVKFTVEGPTPPEGFMIIDADTGKTITYLGAVPSDSTLVLDGHDGTVVIDGVADRLGDTIVQAWPTIGPGTSRDFLFVSLGGSTAAVLTADVVATYW